MLWLGVVVGLAIIALAVRAFHEDASRVYSVLKELGTRQFLWVSAIGASVFLGSACALALSQLAWFRAPHAKIAVPARVVSAIEEAIETGALPRSRAADVNEWLNFDVRIQPREIEVVQVENSVAVPVETLIRVADHGKADAQERDVILKFIANVAVDQVRSFRKGDLVALRNALTADKLTKADAVSLREIAVRPSSYNLTPMDFGIPETYGPQLKDHGAPKPAPAEMTPPSGEVAPMPPPP